MVSTTAKFTRSWMSLASTASLRTRERRTSLLSKRMRAAARGFTGKAVFSSWWPMAEQMSPISSGGMFRLFSRVKAMIAPLWAWSTRFTVFPMSCRYPAMAASSQVRSG